MTVVLLTSYFKVNNSSGFGDNIQATLGSQQSV